MHTFPSAQSLLQSARKLQIIIDSFQGAFGNLKQGFVYPNLDDDALDRQNDFWWLCARAAAELGTIQTSSPRVKRAESMVRAVVNDLATFAVPSNAFVNCLDNQEKEHDIKIAEQVVSFALESLVESPVGRDHFIGPFAVDELGVESRLVAELARVERDWPKTEIKTNHLDGSAFDALHNAMSTNWHDSLSSAKHAEESQQANKGLQDYQGRQVSETEQVAARPGTTMRELDIEAFVNSLRTYRQLRPQLFTSLLELRNAPGGPWTFQYSRDPNQGDLSIPPKFHEETGTFTKIGDLKFISAVGVIKVPETFAPFHKFRIIKKDSEETALPGSEAANVGMRISLILQNMLEAAKIYARSSHLLREGFKLGVLSADVRPILELDDKFPPFPYVPAFNKSKEFYDEVLAKEAPLLDAAAVAISLIAPRYPTQIKAGAAYLNTNPQAVPDPRIIASMRKAWGQLASDLKSNLTLNDANIAELEKLWEQLAEVIKDSDAELSALGFTPPKNLDELEHLARVIELPWDVIRDGRFTAADVQEWALAWADTQKIRAKLIQSITPPAKSAGGRRNEDPYARIQLNETNKTMQIDHRRTVPLNDGPFRVLKRLLEAKGGWVSSSEIKIAPNSKERFDRMVKPLRKILGKKAIVSKTGTGYRLDISAVA